jgi:starch phosphorylase
MTPPDLYLLPPRLSRLHELALDLSWAWNAGRDVFRTLDYLLWRRTAHNPVLMLRLIDQETLERAANDPDFLAAYDRALLSMDAVRAPSNGHARTYWQTTVGTPAERPGDPPAKVVAYFSAEFALHQSLPIYAGGLGVLAGDHCKEASDLGIPFVGVGFMYPQGYFRQRVSADGWQQEVYEHLNWADAPIVSERPARRYRQGCDACQGR